MQTLSVWATVVLAAIAVLAYFAALGQIREARQLRKASHRVHVVVPAEGDRPTRAIYLVLENTGQTVDKNASVTFTPPLQAAHTPVDLAGSMRVWDQPIAPGQEYHQNRVDLHSRTPVVIVFLMALIGLGLLYGPEPREDESPGSGGLGPIHRVLLAVRPGELSDVPAEVRALEAAVLAHLGSESPAVTLFTVAPPAGRQRADRYLDQMAQLLPTGIEVTGLVARGNPAQAILEEAAKGYDLLAMGAPVPNASSSYLFGSLVDEVVRLAPCPSLVFTARSPRWPPRTILVPTGGSEPASRAAALAFSVAAEETEVLLYHVVDPELATETSTAQAGSVATRLKMGEGMVNELKQLGLQLGAMVVTEVSMEGTTVDNLVNRAQSNVDLIILGTHVQAGASRLSLGPKIERLVTESPCSVIVLNV